MQIHPDFMRHRMRSIQSGELAVTQKDEKIDIHYKIKN